MLGLRRQVEDRLVDNILLRDVEGRLVSSVADSRCLGSHSAIGTHVEARSHGTCEVGHLLRSLADCTRSELLSLLGDGREVISLLHGLGHHPWTTCTRASLNSIPFRVEFVRHHLGGHGIWSLHLVVALQAALSHSIGCGNRLLLPSVASLDGVDILLQFPVNLFSERNVEVAASRSDLTKALGLLKVLLLEHKQLARLRDALDSGSVEGLVEDVVLTDKVVGPELRHSQRSRLLLLKRNTRDVPKVTSTTHSGPVLVACESLVSLPRGALNLGLRGHKVTI